MTAAAWFELRGICRNWGTCHATDGVECWAIRKHVENLSIEEMRMLK